MAVGSDIFFLFLQIFYSPSLNQFKKAKTGASSSVNIFFAVLLDSCKKNIILSMTVRRDIGEFAA